MPMDKEKLAALAASAARKSELTAVLAQAREDRDLAVYLARQRREAFTRETSDVEKLECKNLSNLFYTVTGKMDEKRATETAEADAAGELYEAAQARVEELSAQVADMESELRRLGNCDKDLETLLTAMTEKALADGGNLAVQVADLNGRIQRNTAEAEELGDLLIIGKRLLVDVEKIIPVLQKARESYDDRYQSARYGGGLLASEMSLNSDLDNGEGHIPMLVTLAKSFRTSLIDLPPIGNLQTLQNTFNGTYRGSTRDQLDGNISEMEALVNTVNRSMEKISRIKKKREETAAAAREELIRALTR